MKYLAKLTVVAFMAFGAASTAMADDREDVASTIKDYVLGFYEGNTERLERALHPTLRKVGWYRQGTAPYGGPYSMTKDSAKNFAPRFAASEDNKGPDAHMKITVFEAMDKVASAKVEATWGIDYLHLVKEEGSWKIMNVIWQSYPDGVER